MPERARIPRGHQAVWIAVALLCAWSAWRGGVHALRPGDQSDLRIYLDAGRAALERRDPYQVFGFIYLPAFAVAMMPFAALPAAAAVVLWQTISLLATLWAARACAALAAPVGLPYRPWLPWAAILCVYRLSDSNLGNGQVNAIVFALVLLGLRAWIGGREGPAGTWIGLAAALKIVPGSLVLAMAARRTWRALAATLAAAALFGLVIPSLALGFRANQDGIATWWRETVHPYAAGGETLFEARDTIPGQSLTAVTYRLLSATPANARDPERRPANVVDLDPGAVAWIVRGAEAFYLAVLLATLARTRRRTGPGARILDASLVLTVALTIAPLVHKAHLIGLMLPYAVLLARPETALPRSARILRRALIGGSILLIGGTTPALLGPLLAQWSLSHNLIFFGAQLVLGALLVEAWTAREPEAGI